jgi:4-hydroxy-3-polyprenylbenzoate decarboxylase
MDGMIIVPCSMKTVAGIASGYSDNLLLRAADVMLKERRKLVLVARESPLSTIHLRNLYELSQMGAIILPPMLTYYDHPQSIEACTAHMADRILSQFGLDERAYEWEGM